MNNAAVDTFMKQSGEKYPLGRLGCINDTSKAIEFLASNCSASVITGRLLHVDGGDSLAPGPRKLITKYR